MEDKIQEFNSAMIDIYRLALSECNYRPQAFLKMVVEIGGLPTAKRLLRTPNIQSGLFELHKCGRIDLSMEYLVTRDKYHDLFEPEEIFEAERRLAIFTSKDGSKE